MFIVNKVVFYVNKDIILNKLIKINKCKYVIIVIKDANTVNKQNNVVNVMMDMTLLVQVVMDIV